MKAAFHTLTLCSLLSALCFLTACQPQAQSLPTRSFTLQTTDGRALPLSVEVANTDVTRGTGLMHRKSLCDTCGMVFVWPQPLPISMWMKNTEIPLDMMFFRGNKLLHIATAEPHDLTPVTAGQEVDMVLEMNAGWAEENNVRPGSTLLPN